MEVGRLLTATPYVDIETGSDRQGRSRLSAGAATDYVGIVRRFVAIALVVVVATDVQSDDTAGDGRVLRDRERELAFRMPLSLRCRLAPEP